MMKRLFIGLLIFCMIFLCGCSAAQEQIVFPPDRNAKETAGGYKNRFSVKEKTDTSAVKYYYNPETKKIHLETCRYKNSCGENHTTDKEALLDEGYTLCKFCNP